MASDPKHPVPGKPTRLRAGQGKHVKVDLVTASGTERLEFDIVPDESADFSRGFLGSGTPLAHAIDGLYPGQTAPYRVGDARLLKVVSVEMAITPPPTDAARRREENYQKAVDSSDRTNAMIFASSFSGKWGDYDPTGFVDEENDQNQEKDDAA